MRNYDVATWSRLAEKERLLNEAHAKMKALQGQVNYYRGLQERAYTSMEHMREELDQRKKDIGYLRENNNFLTDQLSALLDAISKAHSTTLEEWYKESRKVSQRNGEIRFGKKQ
jgi:chromosome segregation ATPase